MRGEACHFHRDKHPLGLCPKLYFASSQVRDLPSLLAYQYPARRQPALYPSMRGDFEPETDANKALAVQPIWLPRSAAARRESNTTVLRRFALNLHANPGAFLREIIPQCEMLGTAIVTEGNGVILPGDESYAANWALCYHC